MVTKVLEIDDLEALLSIPACLAGKLGVRHLVPDPSQWIVVAESENDGIFKTFPKAQRYSISLQKLNCLHLKKSKIGGNLTEALSTVRRTKAFP